MILCPAGSQVPQSAPSDWFTGDVTIAAVLSEAGEPARLRAVSVSFAPGARTNWHTHPAGQLLHVLSGTGLVQVRGGPVRVISAGDSVWFAPGEEHWHGAAPDREMTHLAAHEVHEGRSVDWLEPVTDADYLRLPA